jgi:thiamine pyrophosphate-dependent acetolactate synthase large subunit-like protein
MVVAQQENLLNERQQHLEASQKDIIELKELLKAQTSQIQDSKDKIAELEKIVAENQKTINDNNHGHYFLIQ